MKNSLNHHFNHNKAAITSFLCTGICLDDQTAIEEINALLPGHAYNFTLCRTSSSCPFIHNFPSIDPTLSNLDYFLDASTQKLIPNEVNYALLLSEGIDSSLIASYLPPCEAFTLVGDSTSEQSLEIIRSTASKYQHNLHFISINDFSLARYSQVISNMQSLFEDPGLFSLSALISGINTDIRVLFTGDGADEIFYGYLRQIFLLSIQKLSIPDYILRSRLLLHLCNYIYPRIRNPLLWSRLYHLPLDYLVHASYMDSLASCHLSALKNHSITNVSCLSDSDFEFNFSLANKLLRKSDMSSMYFGKEIRSPFLHSSVYATSSKFSLSQSLLANFANKPMLRNLAKLKRLPAIRKTGKLGFGVSKEIHNMLNNYYLDESIALFDSMSLDNYVLPQYIYDNPKHVLRIKILSKFLSFA